MEKGERRKAREGREEGEVGGRKKKIGGMEEKKNTPCPFHPIVSSVEIYKRNGTVKLSVFIVTELHNGVSRNCK